jgi:hypothetical protein
MPATRMGWERIKKLHDSGNHERCKFGCSPENPPPPDEFDSSYSKFSRELAERLGRDDPRVAASLDVQEFLNTNPDIPGLIRAELECHAQMIDNLSGETPDIVELVQVRSARRLLEEYR